MPEVCMSLCNMVYFYISQYLYIFTPEISESGYVHI